MRTCYFLALAAALSVSTAAFAAEDGAALFKQSNCGACHDISKKVLGPSLKDIAAKYAGDKDAHAKLETKVRKGGAGSFGSMPMPSTPKSVSDESIKTMVAWILGQK